ncbi:exosome 3'-_5 exonuclease subunit ski4 (Csl4) [Pseudocyphellaria aurata]|nr:exosome 3'->5 exonuclease subunit ski4 (Csl4) [Pseudocyphellaria aurata]
MALPTLAHPGLLLGPSSQYSSGAGTHVYESSIYASVAGRPMIISPSLKDASKDASTSTSASASASNKNSLGSAANTPTTKVSSASLLPALSILPELPPVGIPSIAVSSRNTLPAVGAVVLCRVTRLTVRQANVAILVVGAGEETGVCADEWAGVIRREDIRAMERDKVKVQDSVRVGDLVRGEVVSPIDLPIRNGTAKGEESLRMSPSWRGPLADLMVHLQISLGDQSNYYLTTAKNELGVIMAKSEVGNIMVPISWKEFRDPITGLTESRKVAKPI